MAKKKGASSSQMVIRFQKDNKRELDRLLELSYNMKKYDMVLLL